MSDERSDELARAYLVGAVTTFGLVWLACWFEHGLLGAVAGWLPAAFCAVLWPLMLCAIAVAVALAGGT